MVPLADGGHFKRACMRRILPACRILFELLRVVPECAILPPDFARLSHLCVCWHADPVSVDAGGSMLSSLLSVND